jgi:hypothetical protein
MTPRKLALALLLAAVSLLIVASPAAASDAGCRHEAERRGSIDTSGAARVVINARAGDLDVRPAPGATLAAVGKACASTEDALGKIQLRVHRDGQDVVVDVIVPENIEGFLVQYATLDLGVAVPAALPVELTDSSGDVEVRGLRVTRVRDSSGDVRLRDLQGDVAIDDTSGDIRVEGATGGVRVTDSSGDIVLRNVGDVDIPSDSSGQIDIEHVAGSVRIEQDSSGDIHIDDVARDVALLSDSSGDVRVDGVKGKVSLP